VSSALLTVVCYGSEMLPLIATVLNASADCYGAECLSCPARSLKCSTVITRNDTGTVAVVLGVAARAMTGVTAVAATVLAAVAQIVTADVEVLARTTGVIGIVAMTVIGGRFRCQKAKKSSGNSNFKFVRAS